jgi:hypothetical protein
MKFLLMALGILIGLGAASLLVYPNEATDFYDRSNVRVNYLSNSGEWWLRLETPIAVLCQVNFSEWESAEFDHLQAMEMTLPATDHDLRLTLVPGKRYKLRLTAINADSVVYQSQTYLFTAQPAMDPQANLIERTEGTAQIIQPKPAEALLARPVQLIDPGPTSARIAFTSKVPTISTVAYRPNRDNGQLVRAAQTGPVKDHTIQLLALKSNIEYHTTVFLVDERAGVYRSEPYRFQTLAENRSGAWQPDGENLALFSKGGRISGVSSNWAGGDNDSAFGAHKAIDGDPQTEWSSNGDGNKAWIEITLARASKITGIGFWTRTMGTSAQISKFRVVTQTGQILGVFDLPDEKQMHQFDLDDFDGQILRFEVVQSNGGNTGAKEIAVYVKTP